MGMAKTQHPVNMIRHNYFSRFAIADPDCTVRTAKKRLAAVDFDTFVVTGDSGVSVGTILAWKLGKNLVVIRKDGVDHHDWESYYGTLGDRWVFLDDLIETGSTRGRCKDAIATISSEEDVKTLYVGQYEYINRYNKETNDYQDGLFTPSRDDEPIVYQCCEDCG